MGTIRLMIYEVGDRVLLKKDLDTSEWMWEVEKEYKNLNPKIVTIKEVYNKLEIFYYMEEIRGLWYNCNIVGMYIEPIKTRWELLDL